MRYQPRFGAVTLVLVVLTILAVLTRVLDPYIVPSTNPKLASESAPTLQAAAIERIGWYPLSKKPFEDARRLEKPILLVISEPWSLIGRQCDQNLFSSIAVDKFLARLFVCVRVDGVENPDWVAAYLPYSRPGLALLPDFQIWVLDPQGRLFANATPKDFSGQPSDNQFTDQLTAILKNLEKVTLEPDLSQAAQPGMLQANDLAQLRQASASFAPNLDSLNRSYRDLADQTGGFQFSVGQRIWPMAWLYLLEANNPNVAAAAMAPMLDSPTRDLLDGGFFVGSETNDWRSPAYDKPATLNAEMAVLLAKLSIATGNPDLRRMAEETFDSLTGEFLDVDGLIRPCRMGDETTELGRSKRSSFAERQVRDLLSQSDDQSAFSSKGVLDYFNGDDFKWATKNLGLDPRLNPQMTPYLVNPALESTPEYQRIITKLRADVTPSRFDDQTTLSSCGSSVARLIEMARLLGDQKRLNKVLDIERHLDRFRRLNEVVHVLYEGDRAGPVLADALAYSDAKLETFLALGKQDDLQSGVTILNRAIEAYGDAPGAYLAGANAGAHLSAPDSNIAEIGDDMGESDAARIIRLCWAFGGLLSHSDQAADRQTSDRFRKVAKAVLARFADLAPNLGPYAGSYSCSAALMDDDSMIMCAGDDPLAMASKMALIEPLRLVAPAVGPVYPKLFSKPGYYIVRRGKVMGPFGSQQVVGLLPSTLVLGE
jgi:uncharacterized protein YyaL (SSP411 family)